MSPETNLLQDLLRRARSRRQLLLSLRGVAISVGVVAALLLLTGWAAHRYRYNGGALLTLRIGALLMVLATIYFALLRPLLKRISDARLARLIEEHSPGTEDRLVTAVEYSNERTRTSRPRNRESSLPGREQSFRNARRRKRNSTFATVALRRRRTRESACVCWRLEVWTKRDLARRRTTGDTDYARRIDKCDEHQGETRHRARAERLRSGHRRDARQLRLATSNGLRAADWFERRLSGPGDGARESKN